MNNFRRPVYVWIWLFLFTLFFSCRSKKATYEADGSDVSAVIDAMTGLMLHDVTNPPLAARFYAYTMLAGYEVVRRHDKSIKSFTGMLNQFPKIGEPQVGEYSWPLAARFAMFETAAALQPSGKQLQQTMRAIVDSCYRIGMDPALVDSSRAYGKSISKGILAYARGDGYRNISNYARYSPLQKEGSWYPTPPAFFPAVEPYFNRVRPFTLDSAAQFSPLPPTPYSIQDGSGFQLLVKSVYDANLHLTTAQREIAGFWDCNPFALQDEGHLQVGMKKISPGAHWMGIAGIVCAKKKLSFSRTVEVQTALAITLMDGFMCCWDEKFRSNRIRPETAIRKMIDPSWRPLLQTPPFPEYLSGHSVISTAAATLLTHYFGNETAFTDTVEMPFGLSPRTFNSFRAAADEAAISRFYGGIHFMDAIREGQIQGGKLAQYIIHKFYPRAPDVHE